MTRARVAMLPAGAAGGVQIVDATLGAPGPHEVLVDVASTGVCHTQIDQIRLAAAETPLLLGHEAAGVVTTVGERVEHVAPGDRVLMTWIPRNGERTPRAAEIVLDDGRIARSRNIYTWATSTLIDEQYVVKVPDDLPADLVSIVGCAVMTGAGTVVHAGIQREDSVVVWGAGGIGLAALAAARVIGAAPVIAVDVSDDKLALARRMGADHTVDARAEDPVAAVRTLLERDGAAGADFSVDCTGLPTNLSRSVAVLRSGRWGGARGGSALVVGAVRERFEISGEELIIAQKTVSGFYGGACRPDEDVPRLLDWYARGLLDLEALVTDRYSLARIGEALDDLAAGRIVGRAVVSL